MNQRNEHIGLFFGSFNPIHLGHLALANYFVDNHYVDKVWFVVSPQSPFKNSKDIAPFMNLLRKKSISGDKMYSEAPYTEAALMSLLGSMDTMDNGGYLERMKNKRRRKR